MRLARVCSHDIVVPDNVADWDAVAGDSAWELERIESILATMHHGEPLYDIGAEHGWMSVIYAQRVGGENMVLVEPSAEFWPNIRMGWELNGLADPMLALEAFAGAVDTTWNNWLHHFPRDLEPQRVWPPSAWGLECGAMAYRHPNHHSDLIETVTIDDIAQATNRPPKGITIDVEGAELEVLKGAEFTLHHHKPNLWISLHPDLLLADFGATVGEFYGYLAHCKYRSRVLRVDHETHVYAWPEVWGDR